MCFLPASIKTPWVTAPTRSRPEVGLTLSWDLGLSLLLSAGQLTLPPFKVSIPQLLLPAPAYLIPGSTISPHKNLPALFCNDINTACSYLLCPLDSSCLPGLRGGGWEVRHRQSPSPPPQLRHQASDVLFLSPSVLMPGQYLGQQINSLAERRSDLFPVTYKTVSWSGFSSDVAARAKPHPLSLGIPLFLPSSPGPCSTPHSSTGYVRLSDF